MTFTSIFVYFAIFVVVELQDAVRAPPQNTGVVNLLEAYRDLQAVRMVFGAIYSSL